MAINANTNKRDNTLISRQREGTHSVISYAWPDVPKTPRVVESRFRNPDKTELNLYSIQLIHKYERE